MIFKMTDINNVLLARFFDKRDAKCHTLSYKYDTVTKYKTGKRIYRVRGKEEFVTHTDWHSETDLDLLKGREFWGELKVSGFSEVVV